MCHVTKLVVYTPTLVNTSNDILNLLFPDSNCRNMWVVMICSGFAQTLIFLITCKFAESNIYSLRLNGVVSCINITDQLLITSAVGCGLQASRTEIYHHGFVYSDGHCHVCRSNITRGLSNEEALWSGPHYTQGKFDATISYIIIPLHSSWPVTLTCINGVNLYNHVLGLGYGWMVSEFNVLSTVDMIFLSVWLYNICNELLYSLPFKYIWINCWTYMQSRLVLCANTWMLYNVWKSEDIQGGGSAVCWRRGPPGSLGNPRRVWGCARHVVNYIV